MCSSLPRGIACSSAASKWLSISEPEAITALTAVLASSAPRKYTCQTNVGPQTYEATLINEQGLVLQTNLTSGTTRTVRVSPVGPDGAPHFEVLAQESGWKPGLAAWVPVDDAFAQMLAACAAGHGDCHYMGEGGKAFTVMSPLSSPALP